MPIGGGLTHLARRHPTRDAVVLGADRRSYRELDAAVMETAAAIASRCGGPRGGGPPAGRIGILSRPRIEFLEVFLGAAAAGVPAMVLDTDWSPGELEKVLARTHLDILFVDPSALGVPLGRPPVGELVSISGDGEHDLSEYRQWRSNGRRGDGVLSAVSDDAPFYIGFTSGSTGRPKGFVRSHASWLRSFAASGREFGLDGRDRILAPGPLDHSLFLYAAVHGLEIGASVHLLPAFDADDALRAIRRERISCVYAVPTMLEAMVDAGERERAVAGRERSGLGHVHSVICSGARWRPEAKARVRALLPDSDAIEFYGASELSFVSVLSSREGGPPQSVGRPFAGVEISIRRPDGSPAAPGESGRLYVRSGMLCSGYLEPDEGRFEQDPAGWATVGDVARLDHEGYLHLVGREDGMLISGGLNVHVEEVEEALRGLAEVAEVAVVGLADAYWGDLICAAIRWHPSRGLTRAELRGHCRTTLARHKCPRRFVTVPRLPRTRSGKVARARLAEGLAAGSYPAEDIA